MRILIVASVAAALACDSSNNSGDTVSDVNQPLLSGGVTGSFNGEDFTVNNGVAALSEGANVIALSVDDFSCVTMSQATPPATLFASIVMPSLTAGTYNGVQVNLYDNRNSFSDAGSANGTLTITDVSDTSVAATIDYADTFDGGQYALNGTFEVTHCAQ